MGGEWVGGRRWRRLICGDCGGGFVSRIVADGGV